MCIQLADTLRYVNIALRTQRNNIQTLNTIDVISNCSFVLVNQIHPVYLFMAT